MHSVSYTHLRAHETGRNLVCRLLLEKEERERKCYIKVVVPVVIRLGQVLLPNQDNVVVHETHLY